MINKSVLFAIKSAKSQLILHNYKNHNLASPDFYRFVEQPCMTLLTSCEFDMDLSVSWIGWIYDWKNLNLEKWGIVEYVSIIIIRRGNSRMIFFFVIGLILLDVNVLNVATAQSVQPTSQPSQQPSTQPTYLPNSNPSSQPTRQPTSQVVPLLNFCYHYF